MTLSLSLSPQILSLFNFSGKFQGEASRNEFSVYFLNSVSSLATSCQLLSHPLSFSNCLPQVVCPGKSLFHTRQDILANNWLLLTILFSMLTSCHRYPTVDHNVERMLKMRTVVSLGALLPGLGCYFCIAYTYLFQFERVLNFTQSDQCPTVHR